VVRISADDLKPMVDEMIELLRHPQQRSRWRRVADGLLGSSDRDDEWRAKNLARFSDVRDRLDDPAESFSAEAAHLVRWMDWDWDLERQSEEIRTLAPRNQQALGLLERSRGRE
jgi:hypothetical protein